MCADMCGVGVEVTRAFYIGVRVCATEREGGEAAVIVHRGLYNRNERCSRDRKMDGVNRRESAESS
jgi:hypothetical protein